ncbi:MAG: hypothetical protein NHB32_13375 [Fischerella sp. CENA71]|nr:hypothetical protein [Fischerella sp. CENA71]
MDVWSLVKGSGVAVVSAIVLSGNTAIATINQDVTLNNFNVPSLNAAINKPNTLGDNALKINHNKQNQFQNINAVGKKKTLKINHNKQNQFQNINAVGKKKTLIAGCRGYGGCL